MPNSVTVVSPVSGETLYLPGTDAVVVTLDYENGEPSSAYVCGTCTAGLPGGGTLHAGNFTLVAPGSGPGEVGLGDHNGTHTSVTLTGQLLSGPNAGTIFAQFSVNNVTITDSIPPVRFDRTKHMLPDETSPYFFRVGESALTPERKKQYAIDDEGIPREYNAAVDSPKRNREYDPNNDLELFLLIPNKDHRDKGAVLIEVSARKKKTDLVRVYVATVTLVVTDEPTGQCKVVIPKKVFKGGARIVRQVVLTLLDKNEEFVATISAPMKPK